MLIRKYIWVIACELTFLAVALSSAAWAWRWLESVGDYRPPLRSRPSLQGATTPAVQQVVLVVLDGYEPKVAEAAGFLPDWPAKGGACRLSYRYGAGYFPPWLPLVTGATVEFGGAGNWKGVLKSGLPGPFGYSLPGGPGRARSEERFQPTTILKAAKSAGYLTAFVGPPEWAAFLPAEDVTARNTIAASSPLDAFTRAGLAALTDLKPNLLLTALPYPASYGVSSSPASNVGPAESVGAYLRALYDALDPANAVLVVITIPPMIQPGWRNQEGRLFLAGEKVRVGEHPDMRLEDVAAAVIALLGTPVPEGATGSVPWHLLALDERSKAVKQLAFAAQRVALADAYLFSLKMGTSEEHVVNDLAMSRSALNVGNLTGAYRLATNAMAQADLAIAKAKAAKLQKDRWRRTPLVALALVPLVLAMLGVLAVVLNRYRPIRALRLFPPFALWLDSSPGRFAVALAGFGAAITAGFLAIQPGSSVYWQPGGWPTAALERMLGVSSWSLILPSLALGFYLFRERVEPGEFFRLGLLLSAWLIYLELVPLLLLYWHDGLRLTWYIPDAWVLWLWPTALSLLFASAAAAVVVPPVVAAFYALAWSSNSDNRKL
ncbi:MAG: hypothetical protein AB1566_00040 [Chloroflexota bacterium]